MTKQPPHPEINALRVAVFYLEWRTNDALTHAFSATSAAASELLHEGVRIDLRGDPGEIKYDGKRDNNSRVNSELAPRYTRGARICV